jgi:hypothetical protein
MTVQIVSSKKVVNRNLKIAYWGDTSTRKTEEVLRNYPHVLVIDAEGNVGMCVDNPEIPEFLLVPTKDPRDILEVIDRVSAGKIKFDDGSPVETLCIDSWTVIWSVQQEFANTMAEKRAEKWGKAGEEANATQLDWGLAKRPMAMIRNRMANSPIKYLVLICREKDLYSETSNKKEQQVKIGVQPDAVKGTMYEMNLAFHCIKGTDGWTYEVSKVQGDALGKLFPLGATGKKIPYAKLFALTSNLKPSVGSEQSETDVAASQAAEASQPAPKKIKTYASLKEYALKLGIPEADFGQVLKSGGWSTYSPSIHDTMEAYLNEWTEANRK